MPPKPRPRTYLCPALRWLGVVRDARRCCFCFGLSNPVLFAPRRPLPPPSFPHVKRRDKATGKIYTRDASESEQRDAAHYRKLGALLPPYEPGMMPTHRRRRRTAG